MKRTITVTTKHVKVVATLNSRNTDLTRDEMRTVRDELADDLMRMAARVPFLSVPLSRVKVR